MKIGACMERFTQKVDTNVQIQGLGRMTGYWKHIIENGHKVGPIRTSIKAIQDYENFYNNPDNTYNCRPYNSFLNPNNVDGIDTSRMMVLKTFIRNSRYL